MRFDEQIRYPVFLAERKPQKFSIFDVAYKSMDFITFSRLPAKHEYVEGMLFDSGGTVYEYKGSFGWPRFGAISKPIFEFLIIPALVAKLLAGFLYFGPNLVTSRKVEADEFRDLLFKSISRHVRPKDRLQLKSLLEEASTFEEMIKAIDWWRYYGGKRDEDGHPIEEGEA
jgi:hypothetical protein